MGSLRDNVLVKNGPSAGHWDNFEFPKM